MIIGIHSKKVSDILPQSKSLAAAIVRDKAVLEINATQIFTHGPRNWNGLKMDPNEIRTACLGMNLSVHSPYPTISVWSDPTKVDLIRDQLVTCHNIGAWGLVIHLGKYSPAEIAATVRLMEPHASATKVKLILEMPAYKSEPDKTYDTPEQLNKLGKLLTSDYWCYCVDTAHLWGAGQDIRSYENMASWLLKIKPRKNIGMFHLNGSSAPLGSGRDEHEIIFSPNDAIFGGLAYENSGVRAVREFAAKYKIPVILEINRGTAADAEAAIKILKR